MPYELTINRFGVVAGTPILAGKGEVLAGESLFKTFGRQAKILSDSKAFETANKELLDVAQNWRDWKTGAVEVPLGPDEEGDELEIVGLRPRAGKPDDYETLVSILPFKKIKLKVGERDWIVRTRASMTGCALQTVTRQTKLWWTIEGIPVSPTLPEEEDAVAFAKLARAMEEKAMPHLGTAYENSLAEVTGRPARFDPDGARIRISLADNQDNPVGELLSALYFGKKDLTTIERDQSTELKPARDGLGQLRKFVDDISGSELAVNPKTLVVNSVLPEAKGLFCRDENTKSYATFVAGFARSSVGTGFSSRQQRLPEDMREKLVRNNSPSRQLSAWLADEEARKLDQRLAPR